ncbi:MAG: hypothetical protein ACXWTH_02965 [Methylosarcina sp.]
MNIKARLEKLEQRKNPFPSVGRVIVGAHEADQAEARWLAENPGRDRPELLIVRVIVNAHKESLH